MLLCQCTTIQAQRVRKNIQSIVKAIEKRNFMAFENYGNPSPEVNQWESYQKLEAHATDEELIFLCNHRNAVVRCYAFKALTCRGGPERFTLFKRFIHDRHTFLHQGGDKFIKTTVSEMAYDLFGYRSSRECTHPIDPKFKQVCDSLLIFDTEIPLMAKEHLMLDILPRPEFYDTIRKWLVNKYWDQAILPLARFRREADLELIMTGLANEDAERFYLALRAVCEFPHPSFFPVLVALHQEFRRTPGTLRFREECMLYQAVLQYKTPESKDFIIRAIRHEGETYLNHPLWLALEKYPDPFYAGIQDQLRVEEEDKPLMRWWIEMGFQ